MIDLGKELSEAFVIHQDSDQNQEGTLKIDLRIPATLSYFAGHFPQQAILPAVAIIDISHFFAQHLVGAFLIHRIEKFRVKTPIGSGEDVLLEVTTKQTDKQGNKQAKTLELRVVWLTAKDLKPLSEISFSGFRH
jgi:3-hydroxymyristoyl/3-hydroxydecanoyl-(acyl carrier protein) dehydratase